MDSIDDITVHYYKKFDKKKQKQKNNRNQKKLSNIIGMCGLTEN